MGIDQRGAIVYNHPLLSLLTGQSFHTTPFSSRATYAQCIEIGPDGPLRIESMFPLGASGHAVLDTNAPNGIGFDVNATSMIPFFDFYQMRVFPLFK